MNTGPEVSVIIAAYNAERTIERAINSVGTSTGNFRYEIIVVDDQSTDATYDLIQQTAVLNVRALRTESNSGPSAARNLAIESATGHWIAQVDADDWVSRERLIQLINIAEQNGIDVVGDNQWVCNENGTKLRQRFQNVSAWGNISSDDATRLIDFPSLLRNPGIGIVKPIIRRSAMVDNKIRYRTEHRYGEDYLLLVDLLKAGAKMGVIDAPMYFAEVRPGTLTADRVKMYQGLIRVFETIKSELTNAEIDQYRPIIDKNIRQAHRTMVYGSVVDPLKQRQYLNALGGLLQNPKFLLQLPGRLQNALLKRFKSNFIDAGK